MSDFFQDIADKKRQECGLIAPRYNGMCAAEGLNCIMSKCALQQACPELRTVHGS